MKRTSLPIVVAEWSRSHRERIRITLDHDVIDARSFFIGDEEDPPRAGRHGLTLPVSHLTALAKALVQANDEAVRRGLIDTRPK